MSYLPAAIMAAGSHTSSFTVGCVVALVLRRTIKNVGVLADERKALCLLVALSGTAFYFLLCHLWFSAIVPTLLDARFAPVALTNAKASTLGFDVVSKDQVDHSLVSAGSHTLCWLVGVLAVLAQVASVSRRNIEKLTVLTAVFAIVVVGTRMKPTFIVLAIVVCTAVLALLRNRGEKSRFNACVVGSAIVTLASKLTTLSLPVALPSKVGLSVSGLVPMEQAFRPLVLQWIEVARTPNLPFCEAPFVISNYAAQGASAIAHMPFVPAILLGFSGVAPETIPTLNPADERHGKNAKSLKTLLWLQFALQAITGLLGHVLPNPRVVLNQEVSIILAFSLLFVIIKQSTPKHLHSIDWKVSTFLTVFPVVGYLTIGLMPVIFTSFIAALCIGSTVRGAFGLFTDHANKILMATFIPTILMLGAETASCGWLQKNVNEFFPYHLAFDLLFWQVVGSALDIVFITPRPGKYMREDVVKAAGKGKSN